MTKRLRFGFSEGGKAVNFQKLFEPTKRRLNRAAGSVLDVDYTFVMTPFLEDVRAQVVLDKINRRPEGSDDTGSTITHIVDGDLFESIGVEVLAKSRNFAEIQFGYFVPYGLNLEVGDERSIAYPILTPLWEKEIRNSSGQDVDIREGPPTILPSFYFLVKQRFKMEFNG